MDKGETRNRIVPKKSSRLRSKLQSRGERQGRPAEQNAQIWPVLASFRSRCQCQRTDRAGGQSRARIVGVRLGAPFPSRFPSYFTATRPPRSNSRGPGLYLEFYRDRFRWSYGSHAEEIGRAHV